MIKTIGSNERKESGYTKRVHATTNDTRTARVNTGG